jgi:hypothetical protein
MYETLSLGKDPVFSFWLGDDVKQAPCPLDYRVGCFYRCIHTFQHLLVQQALNAARTAFKLVPEEPIWFSSGKVLSIDGKQVPVALKERDWEILYRAAIQGRPKGPNSAPHLYIYKGQPPPDKDEAKVTVTDHLTSLQ